MKFNKNRLSTSGFIMSMVGAFVTMFGQDGESSKYLFSAVLLYVLSYAMIEEG